MSYRIVLYGWKNKGKSGENVPMVWRGLKCNTCQQERLIAEEKVSKRIEQKEQKLKLQKLANELKAREASRLSGSLMPSLIELRALSPQRFEDEIARMFERLGYKVEQTPYSNDHGRDAILIKDNEKLLVECKRYGDKKTSGRPDLQKFYAAIMDDKAKKGFFVTSGTFAKSALEYAKTVPIELIEGKRLLELMFESKGNSDQDDSYESMCGNCGGIVRHQLRSPKQEKCKNGHIVEPTLSVGDILTASPGSIPKCVKCGTQMRLIHGRKGPFWGCPRYPKCRSTISVKARN